MNGDRVLAPEGTPNMRLTPIIMLKSLPVNRFLGQGVTVWGVSLPIRLSNSLQAGQG